MSLILDALRKIELERKAKHLSSQQIRSEVLHYRGVSPDNGKSRLIPVAVAIVLVSVTVAGFFVYKNLQPPHLATSPPKEISRQEPLAASAAQPLQPSPAAKLPPENKPAALNPPLLPAKEAPEAINGQQHNSGKGINVSGIAWQEERSLRRAVVNGQLAGEGAEIDGAKIIEIKESRVRFSRGGEAFEVSHSSGAVSP